MYEKDSQNMTSLKNTNQVSPTLLYVEIISFHIETGGCGDGEDRLPHITSIWTP